MNTNGFIDIIKPDGRVFASIPTAQLNERYTLYNPKGQEPKRDGNRQTIECLGGGGFGAVVLARDRLNIPRAVKFVKDLEVAEDTSNPDSSKQFVKEILIPNLSVFKHVVPVIDYGTVEAAEDARTPNAKAIQLGYYVSPY